MKNILFSKMPYIIAETAYSYEGNKKYLLDQTRILTDKADAIKYHMLFNINEYMDEQHSGYGLVKNWILNEEDWINVLSLAKKNNKDTVVLADDTLSINFCMKNHHLVDAIEIHAACINDIDLINRAIDFANSKNKVFMAGISGFEIQELSDIVEYLKRNLKNKPLLMYGFQNYPTDISDVNLQKAVALQQILGCKIGYADHTEFNNDIKELLILTSFTLGMNIQEIHYVINEGEKRTDYITAIDNARINKIKKLMFNTYSALGTADFRMNDAEKKYLKFRKVPLLKNAMRQGDKLIEDNIHFKRVENPKRQHKFNEIKEMLYKRAKRSINEGIELDPKLFE